MDGPDDFWQPRSRRRLLQGAALAGLGTAVGYGWRPGRTRAASAPPAALHLQYGADPAEEMTVSWMSPVGVSNPRLTVARAGSTAAELEVAPGTVRGIAPNPSLAGAPASVYPVSEYQHARLTGLAPDTHYVYRVSHDGADAVLGTFRTPPRHRHRLRFAALGDQTSGSAQDVYSTPYGAWVVGQIDGLDPAFTLHLGDLAYANLQPGDQRGPCWDRFITTIGASARRRPWMPALGNHEICAGSGGAQGYGAYLLRFALPENGPDRFAQNFYAFSVGSVRVIVTDANDFCFQDGGVDQYVRGYTGGAQLAWLESELRAARASRSIDWVVCVVHQLACSSSLEGNGCDLGIRTALMPLFDRYDVDLVLSGHDHDYERTYALRGVVPGSATRTPRVASTSLHEIDATRGTVYMVLGGGGAPPTGPYDTSSAGAPRARVITEPKGSASVTEDAAWSAVRNDAWPFGFATFDVDPGTAPGGLTKLTVTAYQTASGAGATPTVFETFTLSRPRSDRAPAHRHHHPGRHPDHHPDHPRGHAHAGPR